MNKSIKAIGVFFASLALGSVATAGEVAPVDPVCSVGFTGKVGIAYDTDLYHRGQNLGDDVISACVHTSHDLGGLGLDLGVAYNNVTDPAVGDRLVTSAWTALDVLPIDAAIGLNWYYYPEIDGAVDDSLEIGIKFTEDLGFAEAHIAYYYDFDAEGSYIEGGLSKSIALTDCLVTNAVRCVPPQNKPVGAEINACRTYLSARLEALPELCAIVCLGRISHDSVLRALGVRLKDAPFAHRARHDLGELTVFDSYHCSRYNTNTNRLTPEMFDAVFADVRSYLDA